MNKYVTNTICGIITIVFSIILAGCSNNDDSDSFGLIPSDIVCTKWGLTYAEVTEFMKNTEPLSTEISNGIICYKGKNNIQTVSYHFTNDMTLNSTLVVIPADNTSLDELKGLFKDYIYLGQRNDMDVYADEGSDTMVAIGTRTRNDIMYYTVGYSILGIE